MQTANILRGANITIILTCDKEDCRKPTSIHAKPLIVAANNVILVNYLYKQQDQPY